MTDAMALTERMRVATRKAHDISDKLVNMKLLVALTSRTLYGQCLLLFYYVFAQIEASMDAQKQNTQLEPLHAAIKPLIRADEIAKDLAFYLGPDWSEKNKAPPAVEAYVKRIQEVEKSDPVLLASYSYHMYMAILAGGQIIRGAVKRSFGLENEDGLRVFAFPGKSKMALREPLRDAVNNLKVDATTEERILNESIRVFKMNNDIVRGIEGSLRQLVLWLCKWAIALIMVYWTYMVFVKHTK